jgi:exonuclease SbcC
MGSGKSSVMDAISFALFGTFPALERRKLKLADIFRMNEQIASLRLEFNWNGSEYKIERKITKGKKRVESEAEVFQKGKLETDNWKLMDSAPKAVTEYVEQLLAVDYDLFTRAIYSEQNNIDYFLTIDPRRRKQELDQLLGLDRFEQARSNIVSVINRIKSNRKLLESRFDREKHKQAKNKLEEQEKEMISLLAKQKELDKQAEEKKKTLVNAESAFLEMKKKKEQYENNSKEKLRLEATLSQLEEELSGPAVDEHKFQIMKSELQAQKKKKDQLSKTKIDTDSTISSLSKDLGSAEAKLKRIDQADKELKDARKKLQEMLADQSLVELVKKKDEIEKEAISLFSEKKSLISGIEEIDEMLKNLTPGQSTCPLCDNPLGESGTEHIIEEKKKRIDEHKKKIEGLEKLISEKKNLFSQLNELIKKADSIGTSISTNEKEMSGKDETKSTLQDLTEKLKIQTKKKKEDEDSSVLLDKAIHDMSMELNKIETWLKKQKQAKEFSAKLEEIKKRLIGLAFSEGEFEKQRKTLEEERIFIAQISKEKESVDKQASMTREIANQIRGEIEQFSATEKEIEKYSEIEEQLIIFKNALLETQTSLRSGLSDAINSAMSEIWAIFYPYRNYSKIKLSVTEKDYLFELLDNDQWKQLESIASGGERACAALSLRVALAMVLTPNLSWLILDEPTHNLDSEAVRLLSETLQTKVPEVVKQTFVITHEEGLMGADFSTSYRLCRDKSGLGPTKQELI